MLGTVKCARHFNLFGVAILGRFWLRAEGLLKGKGFSNEAD